MRTHNTVDQGITYLVLDGGLVNDRTRDEKLIFDVYEMFRHLDGYLTR